MLIDVKFEFDAPRFIDIAEEMCISPPENHDDPWFHTVSDDLAVASLNSIRNYDSEKTGG
jgi:hypothetical protein